MGLQALDWRCPEVYFSTKHLHFGDKWLNSTAVLTHRHTSGIGMDRLRVSALNYLSLECLLSSVDMFLSGRTICLKTSTGSISFISVAGWSFFSGEAGSVVGAP